MQLMALRTVVSEAGITESHVRQRRSATVYQLGAADAVNYLFIAQSSLLVMEARP